jgi:hypothetical protein
LCRLLEDLQFLANDQSSFSDALDVMNRWGGWYVPPSALAWPIRSLRPGLKLAVRDALEANPTSLESDLRRLEVDAPPIRLLSKLATHLTTPLAGVLDGPASAVAATALAPPPRAWMRKHRRELAAICRGLIELDHAREHDAEDAVAALQAFTVRASQMLLEDLGDSTP